MTKRVTTNSLKNDVINVIRGQVERQDPPFVKSTFDRLLATGVDSDEAIRMIGSALLYESLAMMRESREFSNEAYQELLTNLPCEPTYK